jgi:hypothetical protein
MKDVHKCEESLYDYLVVEGDLYVTIAESLRLENIFWFSQSPQIDHCLLFRTEFLS